MLRNGFAKRLALFCILKRQGKRAPRHADAARRDVDAAELQTAGSLLEAQTFDLADEFVFGNAKILEHEFRAVDRSVAQFFQFFSDRKSGSLFAQEHAHAPMGRLSRRVGLGQDRQTVSLDAVRDPGFRVAWKGTSDVRIDRVTLSPTKVQPVGPWDVNFYPATAMKESGAPNDLLWSQILGREPLGHRSVDRLSLIWLNRMHAASWFAMVATAKAELPAGSYRITTLSDDGVRVFLDDRLVLDHWTYHPSTRDVTTVEITEGQHEMRVEYFQSRYLGQLQCWLTPITDAAE